MFKKALIPYRPYINRDPLLTVREESAILDAKCSERATLWSTSTLSFTSFLFSSLYKSTRSTLLSLLNETSSNSLS